MRKRISRVRALEEERKRSVEEKLGVCKKKKKRKEKRDTIEGKKSGIQQKTDEENTVRSFIRPPVCPSRSSISRHTNETLSVRTINRRTAHVCECG